MLTPCFSQNIQKSAASTRDTRSVKTPDTLLEPSTLAGARENAAPVWEAPVDILNMVLTTPVQVKLVYTATVGTRWVEFFPSVRRQNSYMV